MQKQSEQTKDPIGYWSFFLTAAEIVYDTTQREYLDTAWAGPLYITYLKGTRFTKITDQDSLKWIPNLSEACGNLAEWRLRPFKLDFDIVHEAGVKNQADDALSIFSTDGEETTDLDSTYLYTTSKTYR